MSQDKLKFISQEGEGFKLELSGLPLPVFEMKNFFVVNFRREEPVKRAGQNTKRRGRFTG